MLSLSLTRALKVTSTKVSRSATQVMVLATFTSNLMLIKLISKSILFIKLKKKIGQIGGRVNQ